MSARNRASRRSPSRQAIEWSPYLPAGARSKGKLVAGKPQIPSSLLGTIIVAAGICARQLAPATGPQRALVCWFNAPVGYSFALLRQLTSHAMKETKKKIVLYKCAQFVEPVGTSLKVLVGQALAQLTTAHSRREPLAYPDESPVWRLIGQYQVDSEFAFGVLMRYMPGLAPAFVVDDDRAQELTVQQMAAPATDDGKRRELVEGMLFFGVVDNHVTLMQSSSLRSDHLEMHLEWLLRKAGVLTEDNGLRLIDQLPEAARQRIAERPVRELLIQGDLLPIETESQQLRAGALQEGEQGERVQQQSVTVFRANLGASGIMDSLKKLMGPNEAERLDLDALTNSNIAYKLTVRYNNSTTLNGQKLMNQLGSALRHAEGVDTRVKLYGGGELKGSDLKLTGPLNVTTYDGVPHPSEVFEGMRRWLLDKVRSGEVGAAG